MMLQSDTLRKQRLTEKWCDTPFTWNWVDTRFLHPDKFDPAKEIHRMEAKEIYEKLVELSPETKSVVISGGEPMLQQDRLMGFLKLLKWKGYWIEVETNGTVVPKGGFISLVDQFNCSPKLSNSGSDNRPEMREREAALREFGPYDKTNFKFVVSREEDVSEILELVGRYEMKEVYLMPEGRTREELEAHKEVVLGLCQRYGFHFTQRQHILLWGNKRGV